MSVLKKVLGKGGCVEHQREERVVRPLTSWDLSGRGTTRAEETHGTPTQSHMSPNFLVFEDEFTSQIEWY